MTFFEKYSALWMFVFIGLIALYFLIKALLASRKIASDAEAEFEYRSLERSLELPSEKTQYVRAYRRFNAPRREWYLGLSGLIIAILTPLAIVAYEYISILLWQNAGRPYEYGPSTLVWRFILFFVLIAFWGAYFYFIAKHYHKHRPHSFKAELRKELKSRQGA